MDSTSIFVGKGQNDCRLLSRMANRHGLIAGATGTGKTVTLRVLAEGFSRLGVPVFMADVKGDLGGMALPGADGDGKFAARAESLGVTGFAPRAASVVFWDVLGEQGHPVRATISEMGPLLLGRLLDLNDTQEGVLNVTFKVADEEKLPLVDLKDLQSMLTYVSEHSKQYSAKYGNVSPASVAAIQRGLLTLGSQGADRFFGEPALAVTDLLRRDPDGRGCINILAADKLMTSPKLYATFLLWLLTELYQKLPEVGDADLPKLVFFFDEAHLLFDDAPSALLEKVQQVVRLIRSKGVGVYFVSQNPLDIPDEVLGQLGNRVQHALRSFTPKDQKAVRAAAETFRSDGSFKVEQAIGELAVGEALVSLLDAQGSPLPVQRAKIAPPESFLGAISPADRARIVAASTLQGRYDTPLDRESAYEMLKARREQVPAEAGQDPARKNSNWMASIASILNSLARIGGQLERLVRPILRGSKSKRR